MGVFFSFGRTCVHIAAVSFLKKKSSYIFSKLHGVTSQKTVTLQGMRTLFGPLSGAGPKNAKRPNERLFTSQAPAEGKQSVSETQLFKKN
jgi:hypothetical protein